MGTYGAFEGLTKKSVQGKPLKLRLNSIMNGSGLRGAKAGNGLGALSACADCSHLLAHGF